MQGLFFAEKIIVIEREIGFFVSNTSACVFFSSRLAFYKAFDLHIYCFFYYYILIITMSNFSIFAMWYITSVV